LSSKRNLTMTNSVVTTKLGSRLATCEIWLTKQCHLNALDLEKLNFFAKNFWTILILWYKSTTQIYNSVCTHTYGKIKYALNKKKHKKNLEKYA